MTRNRNPEAAWTALSWNERRQILKYAGKGQLHPNGDLAETARRWAEWRLHPREQDLGSSIVMGLLAAVSDAAAGGVIGSLIAERRAAKKIQRLYDRSDNESD